MLRPQGQSWRPYSPKTAELPEIIGLRGALLLGRPIKASLNSGGGAC